MTAPGGPGADRASSVGPVLVVLASAQRRGAEIHGASLAGSLAARGYDVRTVALAPGAGEGLGVEVLGPGPRSVSTLRALRRAMGSAIVIAHGSTTLPAVALASPGTRVTWIYRSIGDPRAWARGPLHRARTGLLLTRAARVVTLWDGAALAMQELYRVRSNRLVVIPNSRSVVDFPVIETAERDAARARLGVDGPVVLYLGALAREKRPLDAVRAVTGLEGVTLVVAGAGPLATDVAALGDRLAPGRVRCVGQTRDPAGVIAAADVVVVPSRTEGMPGVIIEAHLRGVPVVATAVGAVPSMIRDGVDGFVVAPGDPTGLGRALAVLLGDPLRFRNRSCQWAVERYGEDVEVSRFEHLLAEVAADRASGPGRSARS